MADIDKFVSRGMTTVQAKNKEFLDNVASVGIIVALKAMAIQSVGTDNVDLNLVFKNLFGMCEASGGTLTPTGIGALCVGMICTGFGTQSVSPVSYPLPGGQNIKVTVKMKKNALASRRDEDDIEPGTVTTRRMSRLGILIASKMDLKNIGVTTPESYFRRMLWTKQPILIGHEFIVFDPRTACEILWCQANSLVASRDKKTSNFDEEARVNILERCVKVLRRRMGVVELDASFLTRNIVQDYLGAARAGNKDLTVQYQKWAATLVEGKVYDKVGGVWKQPTK